MSAGLSSDTTVRADGPAESGHHRYVQMVRRCRRLPGRFCVLVAPSTWPRSLSAFRSPDNTSSYGEARRSAIGAKAARPPRYTVNHGHNATVRCRLGDGSPGYRDADRAAGSHAPGRDAADRAGPQGAGRRAVGRRRERSCRPADAVASRSRIARLSRRDRVRDGPGQGRSG